ncbi:MAG: RICIN domain-containing protein [Micromonosporaceae bacterium]
MTVFAKLYKLLRGVRTRRRWACVTLASALLATLAVTLGSAPAYAATLGDLTSFSKSANTYSIAAGTPKLRVVWLKPDIFRIWLAPNGSFTDPAGRKIAISQDFGAVATSWSDAGSHYKITSSAAVLRVYKSPLRFELYKPGDTTLVWKESGPLSWDNATATQSLVRGADEQFYGTGFRLGAWALRGLTVPVAKDNRWREGTNASPAPWYLSTAGYGVVRNTWAPGQYAFLPTVGLRHNESRFDAFYVVGDTPKQLLNRYTDVTGKPFLAPIWGLEMGNADCWNASNPDYTGDHNRLDHQTTPDVVKYADEARSKDMPSGWFLPNDGYGCGYTNLQSTVTALHQRGFHTGLWTSTGLSNIGTEVGTYGSRGVKTDVAWIGGGYEYAFDGVQQAVDGIEGNSDARRFVWTVDGWAGTQRNAVVWSGDTYGTWDDMRWHVPAITGAGLSAHNYAAGDVDGIFSGSAQTYARDLQWKAFTPALMSMSGWGATNPSTGYQDKQPWRYSGDTLASNRKYLKLKMRLTPYFYTMSRVAHETGVPTTRAMVLEYPDDPAARDNTTSQQFMAGDAFLVAPVTSNTSVRDGIYLPAGTWTDYWTGKTYTGPGTVNGYNAPLDTLPLFVKGGSIVPMWPSMNHHREKPKTPITYDIHPRGNSSFTLYEDDGLTRAYQTGAYAGQRVDVTAPTAGTGDITIDVGASVGSYTGKLASRGYDFTVHLGGAPSTVTAGGTALTRHSTKADYDAATTGWFFDPADRGGVLHVKAGSRSAGSGFTVALSGATLLPTTPVPSGSAPLPKNNWSLVYADSQETAGENGAAINAFDGNSGTIWHTRWQGGNDPLPHEIQIDLGGSYRLDGIRYLPRQDGGVNGRIGRYEVYVSDSTTSWGTPVATGTFTNDASEKTVGFAARTGRYLRLRALSEANGGPWTSAAEITALGTAAGPVTSGGTYQVTAGGKAIDVPGSTSATGTQLIVYTPHSGANQRFTFIANSDGTYTVKNAGNGLCLDVANSSTAAGAAIVQWSCTGGTNQRWTLVPAAGGGHLLVSKAGGLAVTAGSANNGATLTQQPDTGATMQRWSFAP